MDLEGLQELLQVESPLQPRRCPAPVRGPAPRSRVRGGQDQDVTGTVTLEQKVDAFKWKERETSAVNPALWGHVTLICDEVLLLALFTRSAMKDFPFDAISSLPEKAHIVFPMIGRLEILLPFVPLISHRYRQSQKEEQMRPLEMSRQGLREQNPCWDRSSTPGESVIQWVS